jgi:hypothetical protein
LSLNIVAPKMGTFHRTFKLKIAVFLKIGKVILIKFQYFMELISVSKTALAAFSGR